MITGAAQTPRTSQPVQQQVTHYLAAEPTQEEGTEVADSEQDGDSPMQDFEGDYPFFQVVADHVNLVGCQWLWTVPP